ncbi:LysR family transcriptional regulator [Arthrobacter sp. NPDC093128]|uniref:LysR family transcriptional regulator n=1 Tax=Arthrobacter sp. NPDC093128 TaxID=3154979 RepID=UPI00343ABAB5
MELRRLTYFIAILDEGSISKASEKLLVAQPSLSRQLRLLEDELGLILFDRVGKRLVLTAAGRAFARIARDLVTRAEQAKSAARTMASGAASSLRVAAAPATISDIIAPYIASQGPTNPLTDVIEATPATVYGELASGDADFALGTRPPPPELASVVVGQFYLWAQCAPGHPMAELDRVPLTDLVKWPLITMTRDFWVRRLFDDAVAGSQLTYTTAYERRSAEVIQALAAAGRGVGVLSDDPRFGLLAKPIANDGKDLLFTIYGAWSPLHFAAPAIADCLAEMTHFMSVLYPRS